MKQINLLKNKPAGMTLFACLFAVLGIVILFAVKAATSTASNEPENGTLSGVTAVDDASASGGRSIKFGTLSSTSQKLLIKHGWDIPTTTFVKSHVTDMEKMPFNGAVIKMPSLSSQVQRTTAVSYSQFQQELAPVKDTHFSTLTHNFLMVYSSPAGDLYGDWTNTINNFANVAKAAKEAGFEGIFYDNEEYFGDSMRYPGNCANHTVAECQTQARLRGQQIMDAMRAQWPNIKLLSTFGPWISDPLTASNIPGVPWNDIAWANQLSGSYIIGMVASTVGTQAQVIDGGEFYTPRTVAQFNTIKAWQKTGMGSKSAQIPASLKPSWANTISASSGIYDQPWVGVSMDSTIWQTTITNALTSADQYVWLYTEKYDWWGSGYPSTPVPAAWVDATKRALIDSQ